MSICSVHGSVPQTDCVPCHIQTPEEAFPEWAEKLAEAKAAGEATCDRCGFTFYLTVAECPKGVRNMPPSEV